MNHYSKENANTTMVVFDVVILDHGRPCIRPNEVTENDSDK